jgi:hypothetical protein
MKQIAVPIARAGILALALVLSCAAAPAPAPHLTLPSPWRPVAGLPPPSDFTYVEQWVLPNGRPDAPASALHYVSMLEKPLDEGGLGGYVADAVSSLTGSHQASNAKYAQIESCVRPAWLVTFDATVHGSPRAFEEVYLTFRSMLYEAEYNRPADQGVEPTAHAALMAFCDSVPVHRSSSS